jgi:soluble lytic murein transglycosylase-like protein
MHLTIDTAKWIADSISDGWGEYISASELYDPILNIYLGSLFVKWLLKKYGNIRDALAAYNAGSVRKTAYGRYINEDYVKAVSTNAINIPRQFRI